LNVIIDIKQIFDAALKHSLRIHSSFKVGRSDESIYASNEVRKRTRLSFLITPHY